MKPEIQQLLDATRREIQAEKVDHNNNTSCKKIQHVIGVLIHASRALSPPESLPYDQAKCDWQLLLCQDLYYREHMFSQSMEPAFIVDLFNLLNNADKRGTFKLEVAIELGMSLLAIHYPIAPTTERQNLKQSKSALEKFRMYTPNRHGFATALLKQLDQLLKSVPPDHAHLATLYNQVLLKVILP